jgi:hypothetical protein
MWLKIAGSMLFGQKGYTFLCFIVFLKKFFESSPGGGLFHIPLPPPPPPPTPCIYALLDCLVLTLFLRRLMVVFKSFNIFEGRMVIFQKVSLITHFQLSQLSFFYQNNFVCSTSRICSFQNLLQSKKQI